MKSEEFKSKIKELKPFLLGKKLVIKLMHNDMIQTIECESLNHFGKNILKLEKELNPLFNFNKVSNSLVEKSIALPKDLNKYINHGKWNKVEFYATTVKC